MRVEEFTEGEAMLVVKGERGEIGPCTAEGQRRGSLLKRLWGALGRICISRGELSEPARQEVFPEK